MLMTVFIYYLLHDTIQVQRYHYMPTDGMLAELAVPVYTYTYIVAHLPFDVNWKVFVLQNFHVINFCVKI